MWQYIIIAMISLLALIGTYINSEKHGNNRAKAVFKKPTRAGWLLIGLLAVLTVIQLVIQISEDSAQKYERIESLNRQALDSANIEYLIQKSRTDSIFWERHLILLNTANSQITDSRRIIDSLVLMQFSTIHTANQVLHSTKNILFPFDPEFVILKVDLLFSADQLSHYINVISSLKDSIENAVTWPHYMQGTEFSTAMINNKKKIERVKAYPDSRFAYYSSELNVFDEIIQHFMFVITDDPFSLENDLVNSKGISQIMLFDIPTADSINAINLSGPIVINFKDSLVEIEILFKVKHNFSNQKLSGVFDLANKYLLINRPHPPPGMFYNNDINHYFIRQVTFEFQNNKRILIFNLKNSERVWPEVLKYPNAFYIHEITPQDLERGFFSSQ